MPDPRKGLKRHGMRSYLVEGPGGAFIIQRDRPYRFFVRSAKFANIQGGFMALKFKRLGAAVTWAKKLAGIEDAPLDPLLNIPAFLDRRIKR